MAPQALIYLYLRDRLPDPTRPRQARLLRAALATVFVVFNLPWLAVAHRVLFDTVWGVTWIPLTGPFLAWQMLGWVFCGLVAVYLALKGVLWVVGKLERWKVGRTDPLVTFELSNVPSVQLTRRQFLARATYVYAGAGAALSGYGIWSAYRLPEVTHRTLTFPGLPPGLDGLRVLHLSDLHAGLHLGEDKMQEIVARANALAPDVILQTGDMIDISPSYIPAYVRAFRELRAPLGVVTVLGNHDYYTGEYAVIRRTQRRDPRAARHRRPAQLEGRRPPAWGPGRRAACGAAGGVPGAAGASPGRMGRRGSAGHSTHPRGTHPRRSALPARARLVGWAVDHEIRDGTLPAWQQPAVREPWDRRGGRAHPGVRAAGDRAV